MRLRIRLIALMLSVVLVLPAGLLLSPALPLAAQTTSTLYGTGAADEINIVKLLDMALNKGGMSMSPATIKAFLDYWWDSVRSDLNTCVNNADAAISSVQDFADYIYTALEDTAHYDQLGDIIKRYVRYVLTLEVKSLADFKQLLLQPGTFRQFLLSFVTDQDGNIAGTVDNKIKRYSIGKDFVNMTRMVAEAYIEEYEGYWIVPTHTYNDISPSMFYSKEYYETLLSMLKKIPDGGLFAFYLNKQNIYDLDYPNLNFVNNSYSQSGSGFYGSFDVYLYSNNWGMISSLNSSSVTAENLENFPVMPGNFSLYANRFTFGTKLFSSSTSSSIYLFSKDGFSIKVWKSLDAFKAFSVGESNIYYSNTYSSYDSSVDNSIEFSGSYYNSSNTTYSHDVIQNSIDNSSEVNESTINNIVNNYITNNNYGDSSGSGGSGTGSGSGSGSGDWWDIGSGIDAFIKGVAALLDFLLKLIGDLIGLLSSFLSGLLEVMGKIAELGQGFSNFLTAAFGFIPEECISLIIVSVGVMCAVGVFKLFKK